MLKKTMSILMLVVIIAQVCTNTLFIASEVTSYLIEENTSEEEANSESLSLDTEENDSELKTNQGINDISDDTVVNSENTSDEHIDFQVSEKSESISSEEIAPEISDNDTNKQNRATYTDMSGVGNQNTSQIGKQTYIHPNESAEDKFVNIKTLQGTNPELYSSVRDLNTDLPESVSVGEHFTEGISVFQFPKTMSTSEVNAELAKRLTYYGSCWTNSTSNKKKIVKKVIPSNNCRVKVTDFGYYYNIETSEYKPVDLIVNIEYVDFFNSPKELDDANVAFGMSKNRALFFDQSRSDELEFTMEYKLKNGTTVDVPIIYEFKDHDGSMSLGLKKADVHKLATYFQGGSDPTINYSAPWVAEPGEQYAGQLVGGSHFNYSTFYNYVDANYKAGKLTASQVLSCTRYYKADRKHLNSIAGISNAGGYYTPGERRWNRIKFMETNNYITVFDSFGVNSGPSANTNVNKLCNFTSDGKDSTFAVMVDSSTTMTLNLNSAFYGANPKTSGGYVQGNTLAPYAISDTIITKKISDANHNNIAEIGEELTYTIQLDNVLNGESIKNVPVRDSLLEDLPEYLTWDGTITVQDGEGNIVSYSGDITKGTMQISSVQPQGKVLITYNLKLNKYVEDLNKILNVAVNTNENPKGHCTPNTTSIHCGATEIPVEGTTVINKTVTDSDGSGKVEPGEKVFYQIEVINNTNNTAYEVEVRDNRLENIPGYVSFNNDIEIIGATSTGSLLDGTLKFAEINAGNKVTITYSFTFADDPK
ncbi:isopeptide-forming domain-containing fimbrial protein [Mollicutes bacterium LVI A0039]|nr:isopeptide-forming domain-containing fimbrial protein [Mollicutes bacterium LVI A0039]